MNLQEIRGPLISCKFIRIFTFGIVRDITVDVVGENLIDLLVKSCGDAFKCTSCSRFVIR